jgi:hypothetical protein
MVTRHPRQSKKRSLGKGSEGPTQTIPDAELLELGVQLEQAEQEWFEQRARYDAGEPIECDSDGVRVPWTRIQGRINPLIDAILKQKAQTVAGLIVQTRAIVLDEAEWWDGSSETENPRRFFESLCSLLGIVPGPILEKFKAP